jgi:uncharacterized protein (DUF302 family)
MKYGYQRKLNHDFDHVDATIREKLQEQGFGIVTEIDVQSTLKEKVNIDFRKYRILGACNPPLAHQALTHELAIGLLLPCNVVIWENNDKSVTVSAIDTHAMMSITGRDDMDEMANHVNSLLQKAIDNL